MKTTNEAMKSLIEVYNLTKDEDVLMFIENLETVQACVFGKNGLSITNKGVAYTFIQNGKQYTTYIDIEDISIFHKADDVFINTEGYVVVRIKGVSYHVAGLVVGKKHGYVIDHINSDKLDNRKINIRYATTSQNAQNRKYNRLVGVKEVSSGRYEAYITKDKKHIKLGVFDRWDDAFKMRLDAERVLFGQFAPQRDMFKKYDIKEVETTNLDTKNNKKLFNILRKLKHLL